MMPILTPHWLFQGWLCGHARVVLSGHVYHSPATTGILDRGTFAPSGVLGLKLSNVKQKTCRKPNYRVATILLKDTFHGQ